MIYKYWRTNWMGLVIVNYWIVDEKPNVMPGEVSNKYRHYIGLKILWKKYIWVFYTSTSFNNNPFMG